MYWYPHKQKSKVLPLQTIWVMAGFQKTIKTHMWKKIFKGYWAYCIRSLLKITMVRDCLVIWIMVFDNVMLYSSVMATNIMKQPAVSINVLCRRRRPVPPKHCYLSPRLRSVLWILTFSILRTSTLLVFYYPNTIYTKHSALCSPLLCETQYLSFHTNTAPGGACWNTMQPSVFLLHNSRCSMSLGHDKTAQPCMPLCSYVPPKFHITKSNANRDSA
jgi:hypothetical protein